MAFLAFEGLDGSGKSTLIQGVTDELQKQGIDFLLSREPGGTPLAEDIRHLLLRTDDEAPVARAELLLYEASRAQHVETKIRPALENQQWVLCDRFTASTWAFQVGGRGLPADKVQWLNDYAIAGCKPDLWVLLDLSVEESEKRMGKRESQSGQSKDRFELEDREFHSRVREQYLQLAKQDPERWIVLDASHPPASLLKQVLNLLRERGWLKS